MGASHLTPRSATAALRSPIQRPRAVRRAAKKSAVLPISARGLVGERGARRTGRALHQAEGKLYFIFVLPFVAHGG